MMSTSNLVLSFASSLQHQLRQNGDAIASSIVLEQGKTYAGSLQCFISHSIIA